MRKIKLAIIYQVIFHYRIPFYRELENDNDFETSIIHGSGIDGTKVKNAKNELKTIKKIWSLKFPYSHNGKKKYFSFFPFLFFELIKQNPKVILIESTSVPNCISVLVYAKLFRKKVIYWTLGKVKNKKLSVARQRVDNVINYIEKKTDAIFAYSSQAKKYFLKRGIDAQKIFVGVNVLDTREILKKESNYNKKDEFRILFVGTIIPEKKLEILIEVFLELEKKYNRIYLDIVGSGSEYFENLTELYKETSKNLVFHGRQTEGLDEYYFKSDLFVLPGLGGLAISESMAYGLPVICTTADGTERDLIINDKNGVFIEDMNKETLFSKIEELYFDRNRLIKMGVEARNTIEKKYSFETYYQTFKKSVTYVCEK
jgi:glycosyltransferase involved in cell wall biosynthesis